MSWAEIKLALNGTVGTPEFQTLDKLFTGNWKLLSDSDIIYKTAPANAAYSNGKFGFTNKFTLKTDGTATVKLTAASENGKNGTFTVLKNGEKFASVTRQHTSASEYTYLVNIEFKTGDVLTFEFSLSSGKNVTFGEISLLCMPFYTPNLAESEV